MEKSPDAFRTISEVADVLGTPAHVLRFWESRFPQIRPVKRAGGRRYYRPSDVALLSGIRRLLHDEGLTIRGVQKILRDQGVRHVAGLIDDGAAAPDAFDRIAATLAEPEVAEVVDFVAHHRAAASAVSEMEAPVAAAPEPVAKPATVEQLDLFGAPPAPAAPPQPAADLWLPTQRRRLPEDAFAPVEDKILPLFIRLKTLRDALRDPARR